MEAILDELLNTALSPQVAADPATGTEKLVAGRSKEIHRVPYYQLAAQAEQRLVEQQKQGSQALHDQAAAAAAAAEHAVAALRQHHQAEASSSTLSTACRVHLAVHANTPPGILVKGILCLRLITQHSTHDAHLGLLHAFCAMTS